VACIADARVARLHGERLRQRLRDRGLDLQTWIEVPAGERSKSLASVQRVCRAMASGGLGRDGLLLCLGGGVAGDLGGLCAALYHRGIACVQLPTSLMAQVDSSVGGKTGVNLPEGKNLVGAFHQPWLVACDTDVLATLPGRDIRAGLAEALKHGVIRDGAYFGAVRESTHAALRGDSAALARVVEGSCRIKAEVVSLDEREGGLRAILNFGHTIGHAVETVAGYGRLRHGEAVAIGMAGACRIAVEHGLCSAEVDAEVRSALEAAGLPIGMAGLDAGAVLEAIGGDKKRKEGLARWVLPVSLGDVRVVADVPDRLVRGVVEGLTA
jgi:3-dehydroquinate synthase